MRKARKQEMQKLRIHWRRPHKQQFVPSPFAPHEVQVGRCFPHSSILPLLFLISGTNENSQRRSTRGGAARAASEPDSIGARSFELSREPRGAGVISGAVVSIIAKRHRPHRQSAPHVQRRHAAAGWFLRIAFRYRAMTEKVLAGGETRPDPYGVQHSCREARHFL